MDAAGTDAPPIELARSADGTTIAHAAVGDGPVLVMLPGVPLSNLEAEWRIPVLRGALLALARDVRLVQFDGRGTGRSQRDVTDLSLDALVADLDAVVAARGLDRFAVLGFYHSCTLALAYAARRPERVSRVILFGGAARGWSPMQAPGTQALLSLIERDWDTFVESATHAWLGWPDDAAGRLAADWFRTATTPDVALATMRAMSGVDVTAELPRVRCPVLVLHRRDQAVIPLEVSSDLAASVPDGRLEVVEGASASLFFERADEVVGSIVSFVTGRARTRPSPTARTSPGSAAPEPRIARPPLTAREREVLGLVARGETNAGIAAALGVSVHTVERHLANTYRKIDARGRADAAAWAVRSGLD